MKNLILFLLFSVPLLLNAQVTLLPTGSIEEITMDVDDFGTMIAARADTPEGAAQCFVIALYIYSKDKDLGNKCLALIVHPSRITGGALGASDAYRLKDQIARYPYLPGSYFMGSSPANGYTFTFPTNTEMTKNSNSQQSDGSFKVYVKCSGADSARPITVQKNGELWYAKEWSSLLSGIRTPGN